MEKMVPHSLEAEKSVLGSILMDYQKTDAPFLQLKPDYFYQKRHQLIFEVILDLYEQNQAIDLVIVQEELIKRKLIEQAGGVDYLQEILDTVPTTAHCEYYTAIVRDKYLLRALLNTCSEISQEIYTSSEPAEQVIDKAESKFFDLTQKRSLSTTYSIREVLKESFIKLHNLRNRQGEMGGVTSGFLDIDSMTNGFEPSQFIVLAARPSMGKTTLALNMMKRMALRDNKAPLLFSMEMAREQVTTNMICSFARVDSHRLRKGILSDEEWERVSDAISELSKYRIFIDDTPGLNLMELRAKARKLKLQENIDMIFIDYLQLLHGGKGESRQQEISYISRSLKSLARELEVPVLALSQLSRAVEAREDHRPRLSDLRESGAIEQDADIVMLLYREEYYKKEKTPEEKKNLTEVIIAKQRNGPTGTVNLTFLSQFSCFEDHISEATPVHGA
ncbi:MAG: replicative DNA helicase [Planctomycetota bacterium]|nr:MAG: replicative DNA helicase [Planctomycetota bacterium]